MEINIINLQKKILINSSLLDRIKKTVLNVICPLRAHNGWINICLVNNKKIRLFNREFFHKDIPTDVIAFELDSIGNHITLHPFPSPLWGEGRGEGNFNAEIVISTDKAVSNSRIFKTTPVDELLLYVVHGILHIIGYDDRTKKQRAVMHRKEIEILNAVIRN